MSTKTNQNAVLDQRREWLWPILLAVTIFLASGRSRVAAPDVANIDKLAHFMVYGLLGTLVARVPAVARLRPLGVFSAIIICSLYGITDEFHQSFTPGRSVELVDWLMDTSGATLAVFVYARWRWYQGLLECSLGRSSQVENTAASAPDSRS